MLATTGKDGRRELPRLSQWSPYPGEKGSRKDASGLLFPLKLEQPLPEREGFQISPSPRAPPYYYFLLTKNMKKDLETEEDKMNCG